jgi:hypothetical protein
VRVGRHDIRPHDGTRSDCFIDGVSSLFSQPDGDRGRRGRDTKTDPQNEMDKIIRPAKQFVG